MKILSAIFCVILLAASAQAADKFTLNGKEIIVPAPKGFVRVTDEMIGMKRLIEQMQDPVNDTLAYYIPESDVPAAMSGEIPVTDRWFLLKVNKQLRDVAVRKSDFSALKTITKTQNQEMFERVKGQIPQHLKKMSQGMSEEFDMDIAMKLSQVVPLEPHYESENALGFSMYVKYGVTSGSTEKDTIVAATSTFLNISGTVLFLFGYGAPDQLEWTRNSSTAWAESIMAGNSQPPQKSSGSRD